MNSSLPSKGGAAVPAALGTVLGPALAVDAGPVTSGLGELAEVEPAGCPVRVAVALGAEAEVASALETAESAVDGAGGELAPGLLCVLPLVSALTLGDASEAELCWGEALDWDEPETLESAELEACPQATKTSTEPSEHTHVVLVIIA